MMAAPRIHGKAIAVSGPAFVGKTYLVSRLITDIGKLMVLNFEKHFIKNDLELSYRNFYSDLVSSIKNGYHIICESIYPPATNPVMRLNHPMLNVLCLPPLDRHQKQHDDFVMKYGERAAINRTGRCTVREIRTRYLETIPDRSRKDVVTYNGSDYDKVKTAIKEYINVDDR